MDTQVAIIGGGPAGLLLSHMLAMRGIGSVLLEARSRDYAQERVRAGVIEQTAVDILTRAGVADRLHREGMPHHGIDIQIGPDRHFVDIEALTGGRRVTVYGQRELVKDLFDRRLADGGVILFEAEAVRVEDLDGPRPTVVYRQDGREERLTCDFVAGCDGFHGLTRSLIPEAHRRSFDTVYPYSWLGILADAPPSNEVVIYAHHDEGFALLSMRSSTVSRLYLQVPSDEDLAAWPDDRVWAELALRLGTGADWRLTRGPVTQKGITPMRSFVCEPMRHGRLFLAGDAAHIVPPTGAKGMNSAIGDVAVLASALIDFYDKGVEDLLTRYSDICLRRVWEVERFSWATTTMMHVDHRHTPFERQVQKAQLRNLVTCRAAATAFAEAYTGPPVAHVPAF